VEGSRSEYRFTRSWEGVVPNLERRYEKPRNLPARGLRSLPSPTSLPRLSRGAPATRVAGGQAQGENVNHYTGLTIARRRAFGALRLSSRRRRSPPGAQGDTEEARVPDERGAVGYLTLDRSAASLSGGEGQRIRLATQIGSRLTGSSTSSTSHRSACTSGQQALLGHAAPPCRPRNTVVVVEHDEETIARPTTWSISDREPASSAARSWPQASRRDRRCERSLTGSICPAVSRSPCHGAPQAQRQEPRRREGDRT